MSEFYGLEQSGNTAYCGGRMVRFEYYEQPDTYLPLVRCATGPAKAIVKDLAELGFNVMGTPAETRVMQQMSGVSDFPAARIIDRPGIVGRYHVTASGRVIAPRDVKPMQAVFRTAPELNVKRGSTADWRRCFASFLTDQHLPMFVVGAVLGAPLARIVGMHQGFAFEVVDPTGAAAGVLPFIAATVTGAITAAPISFASARTEVARQHLLHADGLLLVDDPRPDLAVMTPRQIRLELIGFLRDRPSSIGGRRSSGPVSVLIFGRQPLAAHVGSGTPAGDTIEDSIITLTVPPGAPYGPFRLIPDRFESLTAYLTHLRTAGGTYHGATIRRFLQHCVQARADDADEFQNVVQRCLDRFRRHAGVDLNDRAAVATADAFGLVYAGLHLAKGCGALPNAWACGPAVLAVYRRLYASPVVQKPANAVIAELAGRPEVVRLSPGKKYRRADLRQVTLLLTARMGQRELLIDPDVVEKLLPGGSHFLDRADVRPLLARDGKHKTVWRVLPTGKRRMICLKVKGANKQN